MQILPTNSDLVAARKGIFLVVIPIVLASEILYWVESRYVQSMFHIPAPVIAIMIAAVLSIVITNLVTLPNAYSAGLQFSTRWLLKIGIVLYGLNFSFITWLEPGARWIFLIAVITVFIPLICAYCIGKLLRLDDESSILVGVGTGVCGISAILATQQAKKCNEESAGLALATILVFGTTVLFVYPPIAHFLKLSSSVYGIWTGATTLDLPQLVAAALQGGGNVSLQAGLLVKSIRIGLLAPVILMLVAISTSNKTSKLSTVEYKETDFRPKSSYKIRSRYKNRSRSNYRMALSSFPLFILVFFLVILLNTVVQLPPGIIAPLASGTGEFLRLNLANLMLTAAIIGICFRVRRNVVGKAGWKILLIGGIAWGIQSLFVFWLLHILPIPSI